MLFFLGSILFFPTFLLANNTVNTEESITLVLQVGIRQRADYLETLYNFTKETGIKVNLEVFLDTTYKREMPKLLASDNPPDIIHWHAGQRLSSFVAKGEILIINDLWDSSGFNEAFARFKALMSYQGNVYAVPYSYYGWGLYYNKKLIEKFGTPPETWQQFLDLSQKLKAADINPIALGVKDIWPIGAWFDYLNLRINGIDFHQQILAGKISFYDPRIQKVFQEWKMLIDLNYFTPNAKNYTWDESFSSLFWQSSGFSLVGDFVLGRFGEKALNKKNIGYIRFPKINNLPFYEDAPTEVFMIAKNSKHINAAKAFLKYIAQPEVQEKLNKQLGYLPPNKNSKVFTSPEDIIRFNKLKNTAGITQYFDRDTLPAFEKKALPLLVSFMENGDIEQLTKALEKYRKKYFN